MASSAIGTRYSGHEELANSLTHAFGIILSIAGLAALIAVATLHGGVREIASSAIYGATLIVLYTTSTLYHSIPLSGPKRLLRTLDHLAIFLLIAGTYTPFVLIALRGTWGWTLFIVIWTLAALGFAVELSRLRRFRGAMIALYIAMGWVGLIAIKPLVAGLSWFVLGLLAVGGVVYSTGAAFYLIHRLKFRRAIWHGHVVGGSVLHYMAVLFGVVLARGI